MRENKKRKSTKDKANLKGLRTARLNRRPRTESYLIFFSFKATILR